MEILKEKMFNEVWSGLSSEQRMCLRDYITRQRESVREAQQKEIEKLKILASNRLKDLSENSNQWNKSNTNLRERVKELAEENEYRLLTIKIVYHSFANDVIDLKKGQKSAINSVNSFMDLHNTK